MSSESVNKLFQATLVERRKELGLTQSQLARAAGLSQPRVSRLESSGGAMTPAELLALSRALNFSIAELLGESTATKNKRAAKTIQILEKLMENMSPRDQKVIVELAKTMARKR